MWKRVSIGAAVLAFVAAVALGIVFLLVRVSPEAGCYNAGGFVMEIEGSEQKLCDFHPRAENADDLSDADYWLE